MKQRLLIALPLIAALFIGVYLAFEYGVKPQQAVWNEKTLVHWERNQMPLRLRAVDYPRATKEAIKLWNGQAACPLFVLVDIASDIVLRQSSILIDSESQDWAAGAYVVMEGGKPVRGDIFIHVPLMVGTDLAVIHHELGHVLGLAHDRSRTMKPIIKETIGGRQKLVIAQDKDIEALNKRYCK